MMELTLRWYLQYLSDSKFNSTNAQKDFELMNKVVEIIGESNIKHFYPKNVFNKELKEEFYFFTEEKIIICTYAENYNYNLKVIGKVNILNISFEESLRDSDDCKLLISLKNDIISFESVKDSNDDWSYMYKEKVKELFKELI